MQSHPNQVGFQVFCLGHLVSQWQINVTYYVFRNWSIFIDLGKTSIIEWLIGDLSPDLPLLITYCHWIPSIRFLVIFPCFGWWWFELLSLLVGIDLFHKRNADGSCVLCVCVCLCQCLSMCSNFIPYIFVHMIP